MEQLARQLAAVVDRTGLEGRYAFTLEWWPENRPRPAESDLPAMFGALSEQLGLRLEPTRSAIEKLVIDHAQKPTDN